MIIKNLSLLSLAFFLSMTGCATLDLPNAGVNASVDFSDINTHPVPVIMPIKIDTVRMYDDNSETFKEVPIAKLTKGQIKGLLSNSSTKVTIQKKNATGQFNYIVLGSNLQRGEYKITYDFTNSFNQKFELRKGVETVGEFGVGVRLIAEVTTSSNSVDVKGLIPLIVNAKNNKLSGSITYNTYGIKHPKVNTSAPATLNLTEDSIQKAFDAIAIARVLVDLDETTLEPNLLSYVPK